MRGTTHPIVLEAGEHGTFQIYAATSEKLGAKAKVAKFPVLDVEHVKMKAAAATANEVTLVGLSMIRLRRVLNHWRRRHWHIEDDGYRPVLSFEIRLRNAASLDCLAHLFRCAGLALDRLPRLGQRDGIAERRAPRQVQRSPDIIGKFSLNDPVVAICDRLLLRPAPGITRLPWLPSYEVGEAAWVFSAPSFLCFFHCSH